MSFRKTWILFAVLIALGCYIKFVDEKRPSTDEWRSLRKKVFVDFQPAHIQKLMIKNSLGQEITLSRESSGWVMTAPTTTQAHQSVVEQMLSTVMNLGKIQSVAPDALGEDVFEGTVARIDMWDDKERTWQLRFGKLTPIGNKQYVAAAGQEAVLVVAASLGSMVDRDKDAFRNPRVFSIAATDVTHVTVKTDVRHVDLVKKGTEWFLNGDAFKPADRTVTEEYIKRLVYISAAGFLDHIDEGIMTTTSEYGLEKPWGTITIMTEDGQTKHLWIGAPLEDQAQRRYAYSPGASVAYSVKGLDAMLSKKEDDFRDRHIVWPIRDQVGSIRLEGGDISMVLQQLENTRWMLAHLANALSDQQQNDLDTMAATLLDLDYVFVISGNKEKYTKDSEGFSTPLITVQYRDQDQEVLMQCDIYDAVYISDNSLLLLLSSRSDDVYAIARQSVQSIVDIFPQPEPVDMEEPAP